MTFEADTGELTRTESLLGEGDKKDSSQTVLSSSVGASESVGSMVLLPVQNSQAGKRSARPL